MKVTLADVAKRANVSTCTVSRVLNNKHRNKVGEETRQRVLKAAAELQYRPNIIARGLRKQQSTFIGLLLSELAGSFIAEMVQGIQDASEKLGFSTILYTHQRDEANVEYYLNLMWDKQVDGLLLYEPFDPSYLPLLERFMENNIPIVSLLFSIEALELPAVLVDQKKGAHLATQYLLDLGHRNLLHLSASTADRHGQEREIGFREIAEGRKDVTSRILDVDWEWKSAQEAVYQLYSTVSPEERPTAIFACSDAAALGAIKALHALELKVPQDVSVIGFDDLVYAELSSPGLTTVAQPKYQVGKVSMELLLDKNRGKDITTVVLEPVLVVRESCAPIP